MRFNPAGLLLPFLVTACDHPTAPEPHEPAHAAAPQLASNSLFRVEPSMFPFYSRTEEPASVGGYGYRTEEWAAVVFYRDPGCIPDGFNLFDFYDFALAELAPGVFAPRVFLCAATVSGFSLHQEPMGVTPPWHSHLGGSSVPIWFVPWDGAFQDAVAAGQLTLSDLAAMPGLRTGTATHFREVVQTVAAHPVPKIAISSHGVLDGGGRFHFSVAWPGLTVTDVRQVQIRFK